jgi:hypothetical protein
MTALAEELLWGSAPGSGAGAGSVQELLLILHCSLPPALPLGWLFSSPSSPLEGPPCSHPAPQELAKVPALGQSSSALYLSFWFWAPPSPGPVLPALLDCSKALVTSLIWLFLCHRVPSQGTVGKLWLASPGRCLSVGLYGRW